MNNPKDCPECDGEGYYSRLGLVDSTIVENVECEYCNGTGELNEQFRIQAREGDNE